MKTRNDFVSNSSSCSFIISFNNETVSIDAAFMKILKLAAKSIDIYIKAKDKSIFEKIKNIAESVFKDGVDINELDNDEMSIYIKYDKIKPNNKQHIDALNSILEYCDRDNAMYVNCGDSYGDDLSYAVQAATLLEYKYDSVVITADDHFDYPSIKGLKL